MAYTKEMAKQNRVIYQNALDAIKGGDVVLTFNDDGTFSTDTMKQREALILRFVEKHGVSRDRVSHQVRRAIFTVQSNSRPAKTL